MSGELAQLEGVIRAGIILFLLFGVAILVGVLMLVLGLRGRRSGHEPRCRKCGYDLTGNRSGKCPECGTLLRGRAVRTGKRKRIWGLIVPGAVILLSGLKCALDMSGLLDEWSFTDVSPSSWLVSAAQRGEQEARNELASRLNAGGLSDKNVAAYIDIVYGMEKDQPVKSSTALFVGSGLGVGRQLVQVGQGLVTRQRFQLAEGCFRKVLEIREKNLPKRHWLIGSAKILLAESLVGQDRFQEAEALVSEGSETVKGYGNIPKVSSWMIDRRVEEIYAHIRKRELAPQDGPGP